MFSLALIFINLGRLVNSVKRRFHDSVDIDIARSDISNLQTYLEEIRKRDECYISPKEWASKFYMFDDISEYKDSKKGDKLNKALNYLKKETEVNEYNIEAIISKIRIIVSRTRS